jgi:hypothetical protein
VRMHGVGEACSPSETWWLYHYTGATIADHFLSSIVLKDSSINNDNDDDNTQGILWDGITNQRFTNMTDLIHEIQRNQELPYVNSASFHAEHAIIWQYLAQVYSDIQNYPSELADSFCRSPEDGGRRYARTVKKGINHECYHGFGHAIFYTVAKRQMKQQMLAKVTSKNETEPNRRTMQTPLSSSKPLPTKTPSISARVQVRPNSGFELSPEAMCQVYHLCKDSHRVYDDNDHEEVFPYSRGVRVCLEGVVHSVRLFSNTRHDKKEVISYVVEEMQRCERNDKRLERRPKKHKTNVISYEMDHVHDEQVPVSTSAAANNDEAKTRVL